MTTLETRYNPEATSKKAAQVIRLESLVGGFSTVFPASASIESVALSLVFSVPLEI